MQIRFGLLDLRAEPTTRHEGSWSIRSELRSSVFLHSVQTTDARSDHHDEAQTALALAEQLITRLKADPSNRGHHDLLMAKILFREAETKINGRTTSPTKSDK
jgi:hypothetical protein